MKVIGLTGGSGAGKSEVSRYMQNRYGVVHIDGDTIARHVTDTRRGLSGRAYRPFWRCNFESGRYAQS